MFCYMLFFVCVLLAKNWKPCNVSKGPLWKTLKGSVNQGVSGNICNAKGQVRAMIGEQLAKLRKLGKRFLLISDETTVPKDSRQK